MQTVRRAEPLAEPFVAAAERRQEFRGPMCLDHIDPELEVIPLLDSGTDCQDEVSSPDGSPMVISPIVGLLPSQGEDDINLTQILPEFGTLPAFVTPLVDQYAEGAIPTTECQPPEVPTDLFVMPGGPVDGVRSTRDLTVPACSHYIRGIHVAPVCGKDGEISVAASGDSGASVKRSST